MLKIITLKFENNIECFNDSILSDFLSDKALINWAGHFFTTKNAYYWTIILEYVSPSTSMSAIPLKKKNKRNDKYKEILTENDWPLYNRLREWRIEKGKKQGVPPYIIFTNIQLANITATRPRSLNALQEIQGVGNVKKEKYGNEIIYIIKSFDSPIQTNKVEGQNGSRT